MGKPTICICENKGADQLCGNRKADQRLCFRYTDSTIPLLPKFIRNFMLLAVFCACTGRFVSDLFGNHIVGFPTRRFICCNGLPGFNEGNMYQYLCFGLPGLILVCTLEAGKILCTWC